MQTRAKKTGTSEQPTAAKAGKKRKTAEEDPESDDEPIALDRSDSERSSDDDEVSTDSGFRESRETVNRNRSQKPATTTTTKKRKKEIKKGARAEWKGRTRAPR